MDIKLKGSGLLKVKAILGYGEELREVNVYGELDEELNVQQVIGSVVKYCGADFTIMNIQNDLSIIGNSRTMVKMHGIMVYSQFKDFETLMKVANMPPAEPKTPKKKIVKKEKVVVKRLSDLYSVSDQEKEMLKDLF